MYIRGKMTSCTPFGDALFVTIVAEHGEDTVEVIANKMNSNKRRLASYDRVNDIVKASERNNTSPIVIITNCWDNSRHQLVLSDG
jgi:hypothetical protein